MKQQHVSDSNFNICFFVLTGYGDNLLKFLINVFIYLFAGEMSPDSEQALLFETWQYYILLLFDFSSSDSWAVLHWDLHLGDNWQWN